MFAVGDVEVGVELEVVRGLRGGVSMVEGEEGEGMYSRWRHVGGVREGLEV